jgi:Complex 1 protein (LYR family)
LYRDCLRLISHIAPGGTSPKALALQTTVRNEFRRNMNITYEIDIENAKAAAIRALSNYMLANSARKDPKVSAAMKDFHNRSVQEAKDHHK